MGFNWGAFAQYAGKGIKDTGESIRQAELDKQNQKDKELERERLYMALAEMRHKADLEKQAEGAAAEFGKANTDFQNIGKLDMAAPELGASGNTTKMTAWNPSEANRKQTFDKLNLAALAPYSPGLLNIQKQVEGEQANLNEARATSQKQAFDSSEKQDQRAWDEERARLDRESREKIAQIQASLENYRLKDAARRTEQTEFIQEKSISDGLNQDPYLKSIVKLDAAAGNLAPVYADYLKNPTKEKAQYLDQQIMFAFNKLLDPESVVMPGEFLRTKMGQTVADKLLTDIQAGTIKAGMLRPEQRSAIIESIEKGKQAAIDRGRPSYERYRGMAQQYLTNPGAAERSISSFSRYYEPKTDSSANSSIPVDTAKTDFIKNAISNGYSRDEAEAFWSRKSGGRNG